MSELSLDVAKLLEIWGAPTADAPLIAGEAAKYDFRYRRLDQQERDGVILSVLRKIENATIVGEHRQDIWEMAWADVAKRYRDTGEISSLEPSFIGGSSYIRLLGDYARPLAGKFEFNYFRVLRLWLFRRFLAGKTNVYEFGCGSGFNLAALAQIEPEKTLMGLDWAQPAVDVINEFSNRFGFNLRGQRFDFFHPDADLPFGDDSAAMTFCALEQTGTRCVTFLDWLMEKKPGVVISMEPTPEFYDPELLYDDLALRYHNTRKYLSSYYPYLKSLEADGKVEILVARRLQVGSLFHEGYSLLIWRPKR